MTKLPLLDVRAGSVEEPKPKEEVVGMTCVPLRKFCWLLDLICMVNWESSCSPHHLKFQNGLRSKVQRLQERLADAQAATQAALEAEREAQPKKTAADEMAAAFKAEDSTSQKQQELAAAAAAARAAEARARAAGAPPSKGRRAARVPRQAAGLRAQACLALAARPMADRPVVGAGGARGPAADGDAPMHADLPDPTGSDELRVRECCAERRLPAQFVEQFVRLQKQIYEIPWSEAGPDAGSDAGDLLPPDGADEPAALRKRSLEGAMEQSDQHRMEELMSQ
ncbi:unnamed protein product, partial [Prorocentrum cordatum]